MSPILHAMHHEFWHERWRTGQIGFHQAEVHQFLSRWWPRLDVPQDPRVYVPLCGKSFDMSWLAGRGHRVIGSELSPIAVRDFFAEQGLQQTSTAVDGFTRHVAGSYELLEGDALALTRALLGSVAAVYDRAALIALPPDLRRRYAESLAALLDRGTSMLLVTLEYPQEMKAGPPFSVDAAEVRSLFELAFEIREVERLDVLATSPRFAELGIPALYETAFLMRRK